MPHERRGSLIVFADDWGRHPSSCQHLVRQLLPQFSVLWINTIGMRQPRLDRVTFRRGCEKLAQWLLGQPRHGAKAHLDVGSPAGKSPQAENPPVTIQAEDHSAVFGIPPRADNPRVLNPLMWPSIRRNWERRLNRFLLARQMGPAIAQLPRPRLVVTTIPLVANLMGQLPVERWVYYCVDDFRQWPEMAGDVLAQLERDLVQQADVIIAAGQRLAQHIGELGRSAQVLTHGVELALWTSSLAEGSGGPIPSNCPVLPDGRPWTSLERPWIIFWGSVNWQVDAEFVSLLAARLGCGTLLFLGPVTDCDPALARLPHVVLVGPVPYQALPWFGQQADVLIMPYRRGPGLEESEPLKLREYLATGRPVVVRDLPANREWQDALDLVDTPQAFAETVLLRLQTGTPLEQLAARARLKSEDWSVKARQFAGWLLAGLDADAAE